jgi:hypothetical protein
VETVKFICTISGRKYGSALLSNNILVFLLHRHFGLSGYVAALQLCKEIKCCQGKIERRVSCWDFHTRSFHCVNLSTPLRNHFEREFKWNMTYWLADSMELGLPWTADSYLVGQNIPLLWRDPKLRHCIHKYDYTTNPTFVKLLRLLYYQRFRRNMLPLSSRYSRDRGSTFPWKFGKDVPGYMAPHSKIQ